MKRVYERPRVNVERFTPNRAIADSCSTTTIEDIECLAGKDTDTISAITTNCVTQGKYYETATQAQYGDGALYPSEPVDKGLFCICIGDASNDTLTPIAYTSGAPEWSLNGTILKHAGSSRPGGTTHTNINYLGDNKNIKRWHCQVAACVATPTPAS